MKFPGAVANDARSHPFRYATYAAEVGLIFTPLPEAYAIYEPLKAAGDATVAGWHLLWELESK
jgi:hypothetical protein